MRKSWLVILWLGLTLLASCNTNNETDDTPLAPANPRADFPDNFLSTGASGSDILSNTNYDNLLIEIAFVDGFSPTQAAIDALETFLQTYSFKQNISYQYTTLTSPGEEDLTTQEIADLEIENRTAYNSDNTLAVYIYFADAPSVDDDLDEGLVTLGAVYRNTSMVVFESTIQELASRSNSIARADIEIATLNHEFGHLFGLVNLGTPPINDHEDAQAANHCNVAGCLMRAELQLSSSKGHQHKGCAVHANTYLKSLAKNKAKGQVNVPLDQECRLDIEAIGARITSMTAKGY